MKAPWRRSRAQVRLRYPGGNQAHRVTFSSATMERVRLLATATGRAFDDSLRAVESMLAPTDEETAARQRAFRDLVASTRVETRWERVQFAFWHRFIAIRYGVPWHGHWIDLALGGAAFVLAFLLGWSASPHG